jgi:hypothetical protein
MVPNRENIRDALIALAIVLIAEGLAHAQFTGADAVVTVPGSVVSDQAVETSTGDMDTTQLPAILQQDTTTATSVTTGGGSGFYTPNASLIAGMDKQLFSQVNSQNASTLFPGFQPLPSYTISTLNTISSATLATYADAMAAAQSQDMELTNENFSNIEAASAGTTYTLAAIQANTEAQLQVASELQYVRQLLITLVEITATKASDEQNIRAQGAATSAVHFNGGTLP